jgi:hypothetical protein
MAIDPIQLLKKLEPAVRPASAPFTAPGPQAPLEERSFDDLLSLVSTGSLHSGRPVTVAGSARLKEDLDGSQLDRLTAAADLAEAAGARQAVMLLDGRGLVLDVAARRLTAEVGPDPARPLMNIDAAVYVAGDDEEAERGAAGFGPPPVARLRPEAHAASRSSHETQGNESSGAGRTRAAG